MTDWIKKKVLVTGAGGFIGSHLVEKLVKLGAFVRAFVRYNSRNNWGLIELLPKHIQESLEIFVGDLKDPEAVRKAVKGCDIVFHVGALIAIPYSYINPLDFVQTNIGGTANVLNACKDYGVEKIIHTSTSEVYGNAKFVPITEDHPINPQSPYAATKAAADYLALSFYRSFGLPVAIIRPFNTYGPRQSARAVIPTIIIQILAGRKKIKLGSLYPTRDLTYIKDTVEGFIKLAESNKVIGDVVNIGANSEISIGDLVRLIAQIMNVEVEIESCRERKRPKDSEVERLWADTTKARDILGWSPKYSLEDGLRKTIKWFKNSNNLELYKPHIYNI